MARRGLIIGGSVGAGVLVVALLAGVIVRNNINQRAEEQVRTQVEQAIADLPMGDALSYGEIDVQAARGRIDIANVTFEEGDTSLGIDTLTVELPRDEARALSRNPAETTLTDGTISVNGLNLHDPNEEVSFTLDELSVQMRGQVPTALFGENPESVISNPENGISFVSLDIGGSSFMFPEDLGSIDLAHSSFTAEGDLRFAALAEADQEGEFAALLHQLRSVSFELSDLALVLTETARQEITAGIESMLGPMPLLQEPDIWQIASLRLAGGITDDTIEVSDFSASSVLIEFEGAASLALSPDLEPIPPLDVALRVIDFHEGIRPLLNTLAQQIAMTELPDGNSFDFGVSVADMTSGPEITIE